VVDHTPGVDEVEGIVVKGEILGISLFEPRPQAEEFKASARVCYGPLCEVDPAEDCARFGESLVIRAEPDADLEHTLPARALKRGKLLDVGLKFVPPPRLLEIGLPSLIA
jgi:hypothetical protein